MVVVPDRLVSDLLVGWLAFRPGFAAVAHQGSLAEAKTAVATVRPDLLVLGVGRDRDAAFAVADGFKKANPEGAILLMVESVVETPLPPWFEGSSTAIVSTNDSLRELSTAVDQVIGVGPVDGEAVDGVPLRKRPLSSRETEVLAHIGAGLTTEEIAGRLGLSFHTVRTHRKRLAAKLGTVGNDLIRMAVIMEATGGAQPLPLRDGPDRRGTAPEDGLADGE